MIRFIDNFKARVQQGINRNSKELMADDLKHAEILWIKSVQKTAFAAEISFLIGKVSKSQPPIRVIQFGLFLSEDQVIESKGRIANSSLLTSSKFPIILPAKHAFVNLLVKQTHDLVKHSGISATLTALRERFWVLRGGETVKKFMRRYGSVPCKPSQVADLPNTRSSIHTRRT